MQLSAYGKQTDVNDTLRENTDKSLLTIVMDNFANPAEANFCLTHEGKCIKSDISAHIGKDIIVKSNFSLKEEQQPTKEHPFTLTKRATQIERLPMSETVMRMNLMGSPRFCPEIAQFAPSTLPACATTIKLAR
ncbi:MAG: hypothetical protein CMM55_13625 [Rhodospirillaceae bacterium]|nr:hypothetical protein [Rhodospirillaceae bacterium]|tara:strand:- start:281 stop:682 length:402 start_codon:yes stop_codon:yes gene_type:complete